MKTFNKEITTAILTWRPMGQKKPIRYPPCNPFFFNKTLLHIILKLQQKNQRVLKSTQEVIKILVKLNKIKRGENRRRNSQRNREYLRVLQIIRLSPNDLKFLFRLLIPKICIVLKNFGKKISALEVIEVQIEDV